MDDAPTKGEIIANGFRRGYLRYLDAANPNAVLLPDCPYPLRTDERRWWLRGWANGSQLARDHRRELDDAMKREIARCV